MAFRDADVLSGRMEMQHATAARTIKAGRVRRHLHADAAARSLRVKHTGGGAATVTRSRNKQRRLAERWKGEDEGEGGVGGGGDWKVLRFIFFPPLPRPLSLA